MNVNILEAIRYAYENGRIDYNDIPEKYKEFIDEVRKKNGHWVEAKVGE